MNENVKTSSVSYVFALSSALKCVRDGRTTGRAPSLIGGSARSHATAATAPLRCTNIYFHVGGRSRRPEMSSRPIQRVVGGSQPLKCLLRGRRDGMCVADENRLATGRHGVLCPRWPELRPIRAMAATAGNAADYAFCGYCGVWKCHCRSQLTSSGRLFASDIPFSWLKSVFLTSNPVQIHTYNSSMLMSFTSIVMSLRI